MVKVVVSQMRIFGRSLAEGMMWATCSTACTPKKKNPRSTTPPSKPKSSQQSLSFKKIQKTKDLVPKNKS